MSRRIAVTFYYDGDSGELISRKEGPKFQVESVYMRADVYGDILKDVEGAYTEELKEYMETLKKERRNAKTVTE